MPTPFLRERLVSRHKGADNRNVPYLLAPFQDVELLNLLVSDQGAVRRRGGVNALGGRNETPVGFGTFFDTDRRQRILAAFGAKFYESSGAGEWAQKGSNTSLASGLHEFVSGLQNGNKAVYVVNVSNDTLPSQLLGYDDALDTASQISLTPRCALYFQNRLWCFDAVTTDKLYWSEINQGLAFSEGNTLLIEPGHGGRGTAIVGARDASPRIWLFKERLIAILEMAWGSTSKLIPAAGDALDTINSSVRLLTEGVGCIASLSARWVPGLESADMYFLSEDGVRSLRRAQDDTIAGAGFPISWNVRSWVDRINFAHAHKASAAVFDNAYHLAVPLDGATENTHVLRFDIANENAPTLHTWGARGLESFKLSTSQKLYFLANSRSQNTSVTAAASDATEPYQVFEAYHSNEVDPGPTHVHFLEETKGFVFEDITAGAPQVKKRWDYIRLNVASADTALIDVSYRVDFGPWRTTASIIVPGSESAIILGVDPLPWITGEDTVQVFQRSLADIPPGYVLQVRVQNSTGVTNLGRPTIYMEEVAAQPLQDEFNF